MEIDLFSSTSSWLVVFGSEKPGLCYFQFNLLVVSNFLQSHGLQHIRLPCPSPTPSACSNSCPLSWWCHPTISSSVISFSFHLQSFPTSGSFPVSQYFTSGGQSIGASASASVVSVTIQDWFPLGWTHWISLQSKKLWIVFNTTVQKHQFFGTQPSLWSSSHIHIWLQVKPSFWLNRSFFGTMMSLLFNMLSKFHIAFLQEASSF